MNKDFVTVPIIRGFMEISQLYDDVTKLGGVICGGYVRYCCSPRPKPVPGSDVDIYCKDEEIYKSIITRFSLHNLEKRHENEMSFTYRRPKQGPYAYAPPIQVIKPIRQGAIVANGSFEEIIANFDFTVIRAAITSPTTALVDKDFLEDESHLRLKIKNIHCPISSTLRCMKYSRKGYWLPPFEVLKLFLDWERRDDNYRSKIAEFLTISNKDKKGLTKEQVEELEALMRID